LAVKAKNEVDKIYGITANVPATDREPERRATPQDIAERVRRLLFPGLGFLCLDPNNKVRFEMSQAQSVLKVFQKRAFDHPYILRLAKWFLFQKEGGLGVKHQRRFRGRLTLVLIALVCTAVSRRQFNNGESRFSALTTYQ
jgi:hypothetical protein